MLLDQKGVDKALTERHLNDLYQLNPANDELLFAARWCLPKMHQKCFPSLL